MEVSLNQVSRAMRSNWSSDVDNFNVRHQLKSPWA